MIDFTHYFRELTQFLSLYKGIWDREIIYHYPEEALHYPPDWINYASTLSPEALRQLENSVNLASINLPSLREFALTCKQLSHIPHYEAKLPFSQELSSHLFVKVTEKKSYEIKQLLPLIQEMMQESSAENIIDIGGGIGLLAHTVARVFNYPVTSIDQDAKLQVTGEERNQSYHHPTWPLVRYTNATIGVDDEKIRPLFQGRNLSLGLHTCGPLSKIHFDLFHQCQGNALINFGCCYYKMKDPRFFNISELSQKEGLESLSPTALTLATLAAEQSEQDFNYKLRVKSYRYALHIFQYENLGIKSFLTLKSSLPAHYRGTFSDYVFAQWPRLIKAAGHEFKMPSAEILEKFYAGESTQKRLHQMIVLGTLRSFLRRPLELYLLTDRALYLNEKGYEVKMQKVFDASISPRNVAITARR